MRSRNTLILSSFFGARRPIVEELLTWAENHPIEWWEPRLDLAELAVLRWIKNGSVQELAAKFGKSECAIQNYIQQVRRKNFRVPGLSEKERKKIMHLSKLAFFVPRSRSPWA